MRSLADFDNVNGLCGCYNPVIPPFAFCKIICQWGMEFWITENQNPIVSELWNRCAVSDLFLEEGDAMTANLAKAKFLQSTRRFHQHICLSRRLHGLIREVAPRYGSLGQELVSLVLRYESLVGHSALATIPEQTRLLSQVHQKSYELTSHLGHEKPELVEVIKKLESLYPHLYRQSTY